MTTDEDEFYEAHVCARCGHWCDDDECECPDWCMTGEALDASVPFVPTDAGSLS